MTTIWKYVLQPGRNLVEMPSGSKLLTVQMQAGDPTLWALVVPGGPMVTRIIDIYGTGHPLPANPGYYLATVQMHGGSLVWHVFDATHAAKEQP